MWRLAEVDCISQLWFSDGNAIKSVRGGHGVSFRLIVDGQGFLDLTEIPLSQEQMIDANGTMLLLPPNLEATVPPNIHGTSSPWIDLLLQIIGGDFILTWIRYDTANMGIYNPITKVSGRLKSLPSVSAADADFIDRMIEQKYVPYPKVPDAPGKSVEEIKALGQQLFPFTSHSFQLAMCVYNWTTASFTRMVFLKIFEYTGIPPSPFPIDQNSIAEEIWERNWAPYTPQDPDFMHSFMMKPANSLDDIKVQLSDVATAIHNLSDVENRLLSAAMQALPRTSLFEYSQLFSGQVDIYQLGLDHFGIEFLECPLNDGPVDEQLITAFAGAMATYISPEKTITTKAIWSFTDNAKDAMHYSNGILLIANIPGDSIVWERATYVTPLSDDPKKTEYTFMPGTRFKVQSVENVTADNKPIVAITLTPCSDDDKVSKTPEIPHKLKDSLPSGLGGREVLKLVEAYTPAEDLPHSPNKTGGRRCGCTHSSLRRAT